jgi:hypothetical protein
MNAPSLTVQLISSFGAFCCLLGFVGHQLKWMDANKALYMLLNMVGAGVLAYIAFRPLQVGFFVMESVWALVSLYSLIKVIRRVD